MEKPRNLPSTKKPQIPVGMTPKKGTLSLNGQTGAFTYTPDSNFRGSDSFTFRARDSVTTSNTGTVNITVGP